MSGARHPDALDVLMLPRDPNPYLEHLAGALEEQGDRVIWLGDETPSHLANLLLLPLTLVRHRRAGARLVHVHWAFPFALGHLARVPFHRHLSLALFVAFLTTVRLLRMRLVWTAHNVLPHDRVFPDDVRARRRLVRAADLVIVHAPGVADDLRARLGVAPRAVRVIPHGPLRVAEAPAPERPAGPTTDVLFFGAILPYKGVDDLLHAMRRVAPEHQVRLTVAGRCDDDLLLGRLVKASVPVAHAVDLRIGFVPDDEVAALLGAADALVLPYRSVTTSGAAILGLGHGVPVVVPDLPAFAELPDAAVVRYPAGDVDGLAAALATVAGLAPEERRAMGEAGRQHVLAQGWPAIAELTRAAYRDVLRGVR